MPRDFLLDDNQSQLPEQESVGRDFLSESEPDQETYWESVKNAPSRIGSDIGNSILKGFNAIPGYFETAKTEIPALLNPNSELRNHPFHVLGQGLAGVNEAINSIAQFPLNIAKYGSDRLHLTPKMLTNALELITPEDTSQSINRLFGKPEYPGEALLRGAARNTLPIGGIVKTLESMPHLTKRGASKALKKAQKLAEEREIGTLNVDPALIDDAGQFLPKTSPYRNALEASKYGDYNNLFKLQSDLGKISGDYAKSLFSAAERSHGRAGLEVRNSLLNEIHKNLKSQGHEDISNLLKKGQIDYRRYMAFRPYRNALAIAALGTAIPYNPITKTVKKVLSHNSQ